MKPKYLYSVQVEQWLGEHAGGGGGDGQVAVQSTLSLLTHGYAVGSPKIELVVSHVPPTATHGTPSGSSTGTSCGPRGIMYWVQLPQVSQNGACSRRTSLNFPPGK